MIDGFLKTPLGSGRAGRLFLKILLLCALFGGWRLQAVNTVNSGEFLVRNWTAEDGLPDNRVIGVSQTPDGFLWAVTPGMIVRFDGVRFQIPFANNSELHHNNRAPFLYADGRIWLAKEGGSIFCIAESAAKTITERPPRNGLPLSMTAGVNGVVWVAYQSGNIIRYDTDGRAETFAASDGIPAGWPSLVANSSDGNLWFVKGTNVGVFQGGKFEILYHAESPVTTIASARSGGVWLYDNQRVLKLQTGQEPVTLNRLPAALAASGEIEPVTLLEDRTGAVWLGTQTAGLFRFDSRDVRSVGNIHSSILNLAEDHEGNLWAGTMGEGLFCVQRSVVVLIEDETGLPFNSVHSVCQDTTGAMWAVGGRGTLVRRQDMKWHIEASRGGAPNLPATCVAADPRGGVYLGTANGMLYRWETNKFKGVAFRGSLKGGWVYMLLATSSGDLWIGTDDSRAIFRLRDGGLREFKLPIPTVQSSRLIRAMTTDMAGNLWVGTSDGYLVRFTGDQPADMTAALAIGPAKDSIRCLYGATNGDLWIGFADTGAELVRNHRINRFTLSQGLPDSHVSQILMDGRGDFWFAGNMGIFKIGGSDLEDLIGGRTMQLCATVYGRNVGLSGLQASFDYCPNACCDGHGNLFFSTLTGMTRVRPDYEPSNGFSSQVHLERVIADERVVADYQGTASAFTGSQPASPPLELSSASRDRNLVLPSGMQQVRFEFAGLGFTIPENLRFRYRLQGLDNGWVEGGTRREAFYTHLPPGHYVFEVISCNDNGAWNQDGDRISLVIAPFIWETWWFRAVTGLMIFAAMLGLATWVSRRRQLLQIRRLKQQQALDHERIRIARDLHDDLGAGLTEIGLLGDLVTATPAVPENSRKHLFEMTSRARSLVAALDEIVWAINPANDSSQSLSDYLSQYAESFLQKASVACRLELVDPPAEGRLNSAERHELFHAFKEALNNVLRHSGATEVLIRMDATKEGLTVEVKDNGRGITPPVGGLPGDGLVGMRERLLRLGGRCEVSSSQGSGTTVTFYIPFKERKQHD